MRNGLGLRVPVMGLAYFSAVVFSLSAWAGGVSPQLCEPWRQAYAGQDATGGHVIGLWTFAGEKDASGKGLDAKLKGAAIASCGKFGACLESFCGYPVEDKQHAAVVAHSPVLTPKGAFTLEMWIKPKAEFAGYGEAFLADKKYVAHTDYQFTIGPADKSGLRRLNMRLGFGEDSESYASEAAVYETNVWHHVAFTYDGAGTGRFTCDGMSLGGAAKPGRGSIVAGRHPLSIGDRIGSLWHGFPGYIAQVRLCKGVLEFRSATVECDSDRDVFVRMEKSAPLSFSVVNLQRAAMKGAVAMFTLDGAEVKRSALPDLAAGARRVEEISLDTSLRPGTYTLRARVSIPGGQPYSSEEAFAVTLVPRRPARMPVVMWGVYGAERVIKELPRLKEIGFTHCLGFGAEISRIFDAGKPVEPDAPERVAEVKRMLNVALANDFGVCPSLSPGSWAERKSPFLRIGRDGKPKGGRPAVCAAFPEMRALCYNVGASMAQTFGAFPAWQAALLHSEVRDGAEVCFHEHDRAAYRQATGQDYPKDAPSKRGVDYTKLKDFPPDRVIADDHPLLRFLSWYWKEGDGWSRLNTELHRGLKSTGRKDLWTFNDPAVRVAGTYGSGGGVDVISQWTYSYPDPIRIGVATDELFAMARGAAQPQQVMKMTQIIWYRSQTAPMVKGDEVTKATKSPWEDTDPDAAFPTIAPMHLREAFWTKFARPVQGIMYHGWESLVPVDGNKGGYRYTHPQTQHELRRLVKEVVEPLGPALMQVPDRPADVAFLESFASQMFARRGTYGWGTGWAGDAYQMLMWARLQPEIVYDETVVRRGLGGFRVLVMMDCDVLTASVAAKVKAFQKGGGIIVGDERLCPAVKADVVIQSYTRTRKAAEDRAALVAKAGELRKALEGRYRPYGDSATPDVVTRCRAYGGTDYLFAVNDLREFGDYVGQYGLVMENGLPSETTLSLGRKRGHVYDLVAGREVETDTRRGRLQIPRAFGPCEGCVLMVTDEAIDGVKIEAPAAAKRGEPVACAISVVDDDGHPLDAVVPVRVEIRDPSGCEAEWSGYYGAKAGRLELKLDLAANDRPGLWQIRAKELASGRAATFYFRVN
ncbi:MAG: hypothetical protein PHV28_01015 [Kiritimatiellae bacterium]|nr:hypothetical protein [Kiritimatiellia bacterium]